MRFSLLHVPAILLCGAWVAHASVSTITQADGYACMGYDKSRKQTEDEALANARRNAVEYAAVHIKSQSEYRDTLLQADLLQAFSQGTVKVVEVLESAWYQDTRSGDCYRLKVTAEVVPDEAALQRASDRTGLADDPIAPLQVKVWTDKPEYRQGERLKLYLRANKPFHGRVVYRDASGQLIQILPNPYRRTNYFQGGVTYEIPSGEDRFDLKVQPPFGVESVTVYASTAELGAIELEAADSVYVVRTRGGEVGAKTRGIAVTAKSGASGPAVAAEFSEALAELTTRP